MILSENVNDFENNKRKYMSEKENENDNKNNLWLC